MSDPNQTPDVVWRVAQAIYEADPIMECGEAIDGFQVTPGGPWPWETVIELDQEKPYLELARAAIAAMPETAEEAADLDRWGLDPRQWYSRRR